MLKIGQSMSPVDLEVQPIADREHGLAGRMPRVRRPDQPRQPQAIVKIAQDSAGDQGQGHGQQPIAGRAGHEQPVDDAQRPRRPTAG